MIASQIPYCTYSSLSSQELQIFQAPIVRLLLSGVRILRILRQC